MDFILRNAYSLCPHTHANTLSILPLLIARWVLNLEPAKYCLCKAQKNTSLVGFFFPLITQGLNKKLFCYSEATRIVQLPLDCWDHLKADNGVPDWASAHRTYSGAPRPGTGASVLWGWGLGGGRLRPFSWSDPDKHIGVCWSCCLLFACQWGFHNLIARLSSQQAGCQGRFCSWLGPTSVKCTVRLGS